jgi:hypothetical protein
MGVPRRADATESDLDVGLNFVQTELRKLSEAYPVEAERLRIPTSIATIDDRLRLESIGTA